jgi:hypothetical protein
MDNQVDALHGALESIGIPDISDEKTQPLIVELMAALCFRSSANFTSPCAATSGER